MKNSTLLLEAGSSIFTVIMGIVLISQIAIVLGCLASLATVVDRGYSFYKNYKSKKDA